MAHGVPSTISVGRDDIVTEPLDASIDPDTFTPRLLALVSNALVWRESHELHRQFGLGTNDWRVLSALGVRPGSSATEMSEFIGVNKAVVSKAVTRLQAQDLITLSDGPRGSRPMYLTRAGAEMHAQMLPISMAGQEIIQNTMTREEIAAFDAVLRTMLERIRQAPVVPSPRSRARALRPEDHTAG